MHTAETDEIFQIVAMESGPEVPAEVAPSGPRSYYQRLFYVLEVRYQEMTLQHQRRSRNRGGGCSPACAGAGRGLPKGGASNYG